MIKSVLFIEVFVKLELLAQRKDLEAVAVLASLPLRTHLLTSHLVVDVGGLEAVIDARGLVRSSEVREGSIGS